MPEEFRERFLKLLTGIELLSTGLDLHEFNIPDLVSGGRKISADIPKTPGRFAGERSYTLDLLFGDIFFSRAVIFLLEFNDFAVFDEILNAMKKVHQSKLILHFKIISALSDAGGSLEALPRDVTERSQLIEENLEFLTGINSLLFTSFTLGWKLFLKKEMPEFPAELTESFILAKAYIDLENLFFRLPKEFEFLKKDNYIRSKKEFINKRLDVIISDLKPDWLRNNFEKLERIYFSK